MQIIKANIIKTVFVNGTFDLIHRGHIELLNFAKSKGDYLAVAIDSDARVKALKGYSRPIHNVMDRKYLLENLKAVDEVFVFFTDDDLERIIELMRPDIMVVGSDWKGKNVIGSQHAKELIFFDRIDEYASSKIIQSITDRR